MTLSDFLTKAVDWIYDFWPLRIVREWELGIRLQSGSIVKQLDAGNGIRKSGVHWFIPRLGEIIVHECNLEVVETEPQTIETADGYSVTVQWAVTYCITDLINYYVSIQNQDDTVLGAVRAAAGEIIPTLAWETRADWARLMMEAIGEQSVNWGLDVKAVKPTTLVRAQTLRLLTDTPAMPVQGA